MFFLGFWDVLGCCVGEGGKKSFGENYGWVFFCFICFSAD